MDRALQSGNPAPEWITQQSWDCITELENLEAFKGFQRSFEQTLRDWKKWWGQILSLVLERNTSKFKHD
jgi:dynein heavy chain, axonemal